MSRLDEIKARADAATEGPWVRDMHSPDMSGRSGWYIRGPRKLGLRSMVLNSRMLSGDAEFVEAAREDVPWLVDQVESLERWKVEALEVMSGLRELGKALGLGLGVQITGPAALAEVARLTAELAEVKRTYTPCDLDLLTERDALAAQVARVESLAEDWRYKGQFGWGPWQIGEGPDPEGYVMDHCASALRAVLAGSEADTTDTQPTDPGCGCSTNPARARYADGDPAGCYCTCSDDAREDCEHEPDEPQPTDQEDQS